MIQWDRVFNTARDEDGAATEIIEKFLLTALQPLSAEEIAGVNASQRNPFPASNPLHSLYRPFDCSAWLMPSYRFPASYIAFLRWSNGGAFTSHGREFGFFPATDAGQGVRAMMLAYHVPQYMSFAVPFAFDGAGTFYLFDMRQPAVDGEFPIVLSHAGSLGWAPDEHEVLAENFLGALVAGLNP
jgi:hypothetical protein